MIRHGCYSKYSNDKCRCAQCRAAWTAYQAKRRLERRERPLPDAVKHGKPSTYCNWGCRCRPCIDAHSADNRMHRARARAAKMAAALLES